MVQTRTSTAREWRASKWREARRFLESICNAIVPGKVEVLIPEDMPQDIASPFHISLAIVPGTRALKKAKTDAMRLNGPDRSHIRAIEHIMNAWVQKHVGPGAKVSIVLPHVDERKGEIKVEIRDDATQQ